MHASHDVGLSEGVAKIAALARASVAKGERELVGQFIKRYLRNADDDDLQRRNADDVLGECLAHWHLGYERQPGESKVRVINPDAETTGWSSPHSVVLIINDDLPFLVDTARLVVRQRGVATHLMIHPMLRVKRNERGAIVEFPDRGGQVEAWTLMEIDRSDSAVGAALADDLGAGYRHVAAAVADREAMRSRAQQIAVRLDAEGTKQAQTGSSLLTWMVRQRFVFLGAGRYSLGDDGLAIDAESALGLLREDGTADPGFDPRHRLVSVSRAHRASPVLRAARLTCVAIRHYGEDGAVIAEDRFVGLLSAAAYRESVTATPLIQDKAEDVLARSGFANITHTGRELRTALEAFPRDDLFEIDSDELYDIVMGIVTAQERRQVKVFVYNEPSNEVMAGLVYLPQARFSKETADDVAEIVRQSIDGLAASYDSSLGGNELARLHISVPRSSADEALPSTVALASKIDAATRTWTERLHHEVVSSVGERDGLALMQKYAPVIPPAYQAVTSPSVAVVDLRYLDALDADDDLETSLRPTLDGEMRFKLYRLGEPITLSAMLPFLEHLGLIVVDQRPFELTGGDRQSAWIYDVGVELPTGFELDEVRKAEVQRAFESLFRGEIENDGLNRLILLGGLTGRQVSIVRTYVKYLRQIGFGYSQATIEATLTRLPVLALRLAELFHLRLSPLTGMEPSAGATRAEGTGSTPSLGAAEVMGLQIVQLLDAVPSLDDDRIGRTLMQLIEATLRTNAFRPVGDVAGGADRPVISIKLDPARVPDLPLPRPMFEIFVYSPRVEGVHLRGGKIARGGLRWSDRQEDFRTEILGLMKAQMVKNAVIVAVGAKGGFVVKRPPPDADGLRAEVVACYRHFVAGLLDITDNIVGDGVVGPPNVVRWDGDDPYLVVAADKGTATFSDVANAISNDYGFWLGDAFASGGSVGYDHKVMGITARGAWESVRRHARVLGKDADREALTVVGIGDMSGDVFGNGLLRSPHVRLLAAFDHRHIFIDPNPDPAASFAERRRLFELPRSSWANYDTALISAGGGVFPRSSKHIEISETARSALGIETKSLTPNELVTAILKAPVDLLWNGGIGTYVKASTETSVDVGDRTNDSVRVDGQDLRCRIVGEGGNLGLTQRGRIEFALDGGLINTDAIDNSAGVDCSDHEVNIKILLNGLVAGGELTMKQRNELLASMTDEIGELVLDDNRAQTLALSIARKQAVPMVDVHARYISSLEADGWLNRAIEFLPTDKQLAERQASGWGLTTPELAVLLAYTKTADIADVAGTASFVADPYLTPDLEHYFPKEIQQRFPDAIHGHRLRDEILLTQLINQMVNHQGTSFDHRMTEETGAVTADVVRAWIVARDIFSMPSIWEEIEALGATVSLDTQLGLFLDLRRMVERSVMWLLRHRRPPIPFAETVAEFRTGIATLLIHLAPLVRGPLADQTFALAAERVVSGVPSDLAERSAVWPLMHTSFDLIDLAERHGRPVSEVATVYWTLLEQLDLTWLWNAVGTLPRIDRWQSQARAALRDDLLAALAELADDVLAVGGSPDRWAQINDRVVQRSRNVFSDIRRCGEFDLTTLTVALRQLRNLVLSTAPASE